MLQWDGDGVSAMQAVAARPSLGKFSPWGRRQGDPAGPCLVPCDIKVSWCWKNISPPPIPPGGLRRR